MLPATGKFRDLDCPFYENNCCDRPYCHFRHNRKEKNKEREKMILKELVAKSVKKLLAGDATIRQSILGKEETKTIDTSKNENVVQAENSQNKNDEVPDYQPTPINELNKSSEDSATENESNTNLPGYAPKEKRHIPVPYTPLQPHRYKRRGSLFSSLMENDYQPVSTPTESLSTKPYNPTPIFSSELNLSPNYEPSYGTSNSASSAISEVTGTHITNAECKEYTPASLENLDTNYLPSYNPTPKVDNSSNQNELTDTIENIDLDSFEEEFGIIQDILDEETKKESAEVDKIKKKPHHHSTSSSRSKSKEETKGKSDKSKHSKSSSRNEKKYSSTESANKKSTSESSKIKSVKSHSDKKVSTHKSTKDTDKKHKSSSKSSSCSNSSSNSSKKHSEQKSKNKSSSSSTDKRSREKDKKSANDSNASGSKSSKTNEDSNKRKLSIEENLQMLDLEFDDIDINFTSNFPNAMKHATKNTNDENTSIFNSDSEDDCYSECYKIFQSYSPPKLENETSADSNIHTDELEIITDNGTRKRRVAHANAVGTRTVTDRVREKRTPAMLMMERYKKSASSESVVPKPEDDIPEPKKKRISLIGSSVISSTSQNKTKKISAVSNVQSILEAKAKLQEMSRLASTANKGDTHTKSELIKLASRNSASEVGCSKTIAQTLMKGGKRIAHSPVSAATSWPSVLQPEKTKLPLNVRTKMYYILVEECLKLYSTEAQAFERAQNEELNCFNRCNTISTYRNSVMLNLNRLRKEISGGGTSGTVASSSKSFDENGKKIFSEEEERQFYDKIKDSCLTNTDFENNGYPRECGILGKAIFKTYKKQYKSVGNERQCIRCMKIYNVDKNGYPVVQEDCVYHYLKKRTLRGSAFYLCCKSNNDYGCTVSNTHVCETQDGPGPTKGYQQTLPPDGPNDPRSKKIYALDCEMCYTVKGLELTRVTVIDINESVVFDQIVNPFNQIIDYNTNFSGLTSKSFEKCNTNIVQVQAALLSRFNSDTILIGHSLESDLKALKLIHNKVIDTAILFPHRMGPPNKVALRVLSALYLNTIIQNNPNGHDSSEDAVACMRLVKLRFLDDRIKIQQFKEQGNK